MLILLLSTFEMGRQPFGLASPAAWLRREGHMVDVWDLSRDSFDEARVRAADAVAFYLPMHTATVLALALLPRVRQANPAARLAAYGLYAPVNAARLREAGAEAILGGEFEEGLVAWARGDAASGISLNRQRFTVPDRAGLPALARYAQLETAQGARTAGYTEATRGCKHVCRHCPIVPVYQGAFRVVQRDVVLADIAQQVAAGARHITFGDPDFLNGPGHALALVEALAARFPGVTYDVTIKIEHLLRHRALLPVLRRTGCAFVTSAVESLDDAILERFSKGHTKADFFEALSLMRDAQLPLSPTFVAFTPWTSREAHSNLLETVADLGLIENIAPVQYSIRLLVPAGSLLLGQMETLPFDAERLVYPWVHPDAGMDRLWEETARIAQQRGTRRELFGRIWAAAHERLFDRPAPDRATIPYLNEPWYC